MRIGVHWGSQRHREVARTQSPLKSGRRRLKQERQVARRFVTTARALRLGLPISEPNASLRSQRVALPPAPRMDGRSRRRRTRSFATRFCLRPRAAPSTALTAAPGSRCNCGCSNSLVWHREDDCAMLESGMWCLENRQPIQPS